MAWNYECVVEYTDPITGEAKKLDLRLYNSPKLTDNELTAEMIDYAADVIGDYKFSKLNLTDVAVYVGSIEICEEWET